MHGLSQRKYFKALPLTLCVALCLVATSTSPLLAVSFNLTLDSLTNHNTSAYAAYNQSNFGANFGPTSWVSQSGATIAVDPSKMDESLNPVTPGHVSRTDVHTLIPSRPDLRWFAHATPWFGGSSHINIGLNNNTTSYVQAMITDMKNRGFNGVVIDWYGQGHETDQVVQKIKSYLASIPGNTFTYIIMVDKGVQGGLSTNNLVTQIQYCQSQYFSDPNYEREPLSTGNPILMFFGVRSALGASAMSDLKTETGGSMVWVEQGTSYLGEAWEDECFEWTHEYDTGVNYSDPFNLSAVTAPYSTIKSSGKLAFGAMCGNFNGTLTKSVSWSMGKYLPSSNGLCVVQRAGVINAAIFSNMKRMQWTTWSDWEEGTEVEAGIENNFVVNAQVSTPNVISWSFTGDERTIDHYEVYAATNGVNCGLLCSVRTGLYSTNLSQIGLAPGSYQLYVDAVAKPCIRDHMSQPVTAVISAGPFVTQQPTNLTVSYGASATFSVSATGNSPLSYTWYDQGANVVGTSSTLVITNATQNNSYYAVITNQYGTATSSTATLTVLSIPAVVSDIQPLYQIVWQGDAVAFAVTAGGMPPLSYQWSLNGQGIPGATNSSYVFPALTGTNYYSVAISNGVGSANSSTGLVVGVAVPFITNPSNYNSMQITFSGYTNGVGLTNFPVLVRLSTNTPGFSYSQFASPTDGADLRFAAANGRELPFEIDEWNPNGESDVWVQTPSITSSNDFITAYWGNVSDSAMQTWSTNGTAWSTLSGSNGFIVVYHLRESGFPFADSTLEYPSTSGVAPTLTNGVVAHASGFNGTSQFLNAGLVNSGKAFTASAWVNIAPSASSEQTIWCNKQGGWNVAGFDFYVNSYQTADGTIYFDTADGVGGNVSARTVANAVIFGQWHLLTGTLDGINGSVHVYIDGVDQTINTGAVTAFQVTNYVRLGSLLTGSPGATGNLYFNGLMDEARLESGVRSPAWVWASWATVANPAFATYSSIVPPNVSLQYQVVNGQLVLSWSTGVLQTALTVTGPYTDVATPSPYSVSPSGPQQYFRVRIPR